MNTKTLRFKNSMGILPLKNTRSRGGCSLCKASKVKCDELKPSCSRCNRKNAVCCYNKKSYSNQEPIKLVFSDFSGIKDALGTLPLPELLNSDHKLLSYFQYFFEVISYMVFPSTAKVKDGSFRNPFIHVIPRVAITDNPVLGVCLAISMAHKALLMSEPVPFDVILQTFEVSNVPYKLDYKSGGLVSNDSLENTILVKLLLVCFGLTLFQSATDDWKLHLKHARLLFYKYYILPNKEKLFNSNSEDLPKIIDEIFDTDLKKFLVNTLAFYSIHVMLCCSLEYKQSSNFFYETTQESEDFDKFWLILSQNDNSCVTDYLIFNGNYLKNLGHHLFIFDFSYLPICHSIVVLIYRKNEKKTISDSDYIIYNDLKRRLKENHTKVQDRYFNLTVQYLNEPKQQKLLDFYYHLNVIFYHTFLIHINRRLINLSISNEEIQSSCEEIIKHIKTSVDGDSVFETSIFSSLCIVSFESDDPETVNYCRKRITEHSIGFGRPIDCLEEFWAEDNIGAFCFNIFPKKASFTQFLEQYGVKSSLF